MEISNRSSTVVNTFFAIIKGLSIDYVELNILIATGDTMHKSM